MKPIHMGLKQFYYFFDIWVQIEKKTIKLVNPFSLIQKQKKKKRKSQQSKWSHCGWAKINEYSTTEKIQKLQAGKRTKKKHKLEIKKFGVGSFTAAAANFGRSGKRPGRGGDGFFIHFLPRVEGEGVELMKWRGRAHLKEANGKQKS